MIEMALLHTSKETDNKVRWDADVNGTVFSLYIPQWRVPKPFPKRIKVGIAPVESSSSCKSLSRQEVEADNTMALRGIEAFARSFKKHTKTVRYSPIGDPKTWEIGEPYIPYEMLPNDADEVRVTVEWLQ